MTKYYGDIAEDATIKIPFNTVDSSGASVTITDLVAADVYIYKDGTVQPTKGAGVTVSINHGSTTGSHLITIDTSNTTDAGFYVVGADYEVELVGVTVDTQTINAWIDVFSIENRFNEVDVTKIGGDTQSATDLKNFADTGYNPVTSKVTGVLLVDTTTTNTDMRGTDSANTVVPDVAGTAAGLHITTDGLIANINDVVKSGGTGDCAAIMADTNELQTNQGAWATATSVTVSDKTGFSLSSAGVTAITDDIFAETGWNTGDSITFGAGFNLIAAALVGKESVSGSTITVYDASDGTTALYTALIAASGDIRTVTIA